VSKVPNYRWSLSSIGVTVGAALICVTTIYYLHRRGMWKPFSSLASGLSILGGLALLVSLALAIVALAKEEPPYIALLALCLSLLSFLLYVQ
jgi:hypothetical protein